MTLRAGPLALVGGEEFMPGNEPHDAFLVAAAQRLNADRPAFIIATAAARQQPDQAVDMARGWFRELGLDMEELPLRRRGQASDVGIVAAAATGRFFYLCGGDPGIVPQVLAGTPAWEAILAAWCSGAPLAGSSAGAMALGEWTLTRERMPGDARRVPRPALAVLPRVAVLPHYAAFGHRWVDSAQAALAGKDPVLVGVDERSAAVWSDRTWRAMGRGTVTVFASGSPTVAAAGDRSALPIPQPTGFGPA
jgi:cyanophycinase